MALNTILQPLRSSLEDRQHAIADTGNISSNKKQAVPQPDSVQATCGKISHLLDT
jgi:hypothetical protein